MKKLIGAVVLAVALLGASGVKAEKDPKSTIEALLKNCKQKDAAPGLYCLGVIRGAAVTLAQSKDNEYKFCPGGFVSYEQMRQVFINWADANPKHWQVEGVTGVIAILMDTWPCK